MEIITSKSNEKVKYIKSLNEKKYRDEYGVFYLEGIKVITEILEEEAIDILFIAYSEDILKKNHGGNLLLQKIEKLEMQQKLLVSQEVFETLTDTVTTQGVLAVMKKKEYTLEEVITHTDKNILILDRVQDAGNMGTIIRSANAFDIDAIICTNGTVDMYSPKVVRSTMGSILLMKVCYTNQLNNLKETLHKADYQMVATSLEGNKSLSELDFSKKYAFILGNEASGVSDLLQSMADECVKIPMSPRQESLNVGVAAGIILYEQYIRRNHQ